MRSSVLILAIFLSLVALSPLIIPKEYVENRYNMDYFSDNPKAVPPQWINLFSSADRAVQKTLMPSEIEESKGEMRRFAYVYEYEYTYDVPPQDIVLELWESVDEQYSLVMIRIVKDEEIEIYRGDTMHRSVVDGYHVGKYSFSFLGKRVIYSTTDRTTPYEFFEPMNALFAEKGTYKILIDVFIFDGTIIEKQEIRVVGSVYGLLGTDTSGRDVCYELLYSSKNTVIIVFLASVFAVVFGTVYGVTGGYVGGKLDAVMQWITTLVMAFPILPTFVFLIWYFSTDMVGFVMEISLLKFSLILSLLTWPLYAKTARSMCLHIKTAEHVAVARGFGASTKRIIVKHIMPQLYPFTVASISVNIPKILVFISLLGFFSILPGWGSNWGSFLAEAYKEGAILKGMWWWILSPGMLIAILAIAFVNLSREIERKYDTGRLDENAGHRQKKKKKGLEKVSEGQNEVFVEKGEQERRVMPLWGRYIEKLDSFVSELESGNTKKYFKYYKEYTNLEKFFSRSVINFGPRLPEKEKVEKKLDYCSTLLKNMLEEV